MKTQNLHKLIFTAMIVYLAVKLATLGSSIALDASLTTVKLTWKKDR